MDAKNLEVLRQLKDQIAVSMEKPEVKSGTIDPQALLRLLTDANLNIHDVPSDSKRTRDNKKKKHSPAKVCPSKAVSHDPARTKQKSPWPANEFFRSGSDTSFPSRLLAPIAPTPVNAPQRTSRAKGGKFVFRGVSVSQAQYKALKESLALMIYGNDHAILTKKFDALSFYLAKSKESRKCLSQARQASPNQMLQGSEGSL